MNDRSERIDYGIDAPGLVRTFFIVGSSALSATLVTVMTQWLGSPWNIVVASALGGVAFYALGMGCFMLYGSKVAKLTRRERLLDLIPLSGTEKILDAGCGRGLMMIGAAKRLTTGKAIGIDVWQTDDQSDNSADATIANARLAGVAECTEVHTIDMRTLSFADETFDAIVSHWAVHNLYAPNDRTIALREMVRVLKPGGYILLADIEHHDEYVSILSASGLTDVKVVDNGLSTRVAAAISFGSFRPATVYARK